MTPHRGPVFVDFPLDVFGPSAGDVPAVDAVSGRGAEPDPDAVARLAELIARRRAAGVHRRQRRLLGRRRGRAAAAVEHLRVPCFFNGLGRGTLPADHELAFLRTRGLLKERADLVVVIGTPLDFRLGFGRFGDAAVAHVVDSDGQRGRTRRRADGRRRHRGDAARRWPTTPARAPTTSDWIAELRAAEDSARGEAEAPLLAADTDPIKPSRIYGELRRRLARDAVVICDGGDFASYAGKFVEVFEPGCWLDTGPYGCLGNGIGLRDRGPGRAARPRRSSLLLGDGAAGFSLMDADSLVRHGLPVVMIVGNNGMWGLEKHPMQAIYGWDVACDLQPGCRYDEVVRALGGARRDGHRAGRDRPGARPGVRRRACRTSSTW